MERLVGDLLDSSAIETGSLRLHPDWCDVSLVVEAAAACVRGEQASASQSTTVIEPCGPITIASSRWW